MDAAIEFKTSRRGPAGGSRIGSGLRRDSGAARASMGRRRPSRAALWALAAALTLSLGPATTLASDAVTANERYTSLGVAARGVPESWGEVMHVAETARAGLVTVEYSPIVGEASLGRVVAGWDGSGTSAARDFDAWAHEEGYLQRPFHGIALWARDDKGALLVAAASCQIAAGDQLCETERGLPIDELTRRRSLRSWRTALLRDIRLLEDPAQSPLLVEIARYQLLSSDASVYAAWRDKVYDYGCSQHKDNDTKDKCDHCCSKKADDERIWVCNALVGSLAAVAGYCVGGGPAGGPIAFLSTVVISRLLTSACHDVVAKKKLECESRCSDAHGDDGSGHQLQYGF